MSNKTNWMTSSEKATVRPSNEAKTVKNKAARAARRAKGIPVQPNVIGGVPVNNREFRRFEKFGLAPLHARA